MNEDVIAEKKRNSPPRGAGRAKKSRRFTVEEKLRAVRLHLEEGFSMALVAQELKVSKSSVDLGCKPTGSVARLACSRQSGPSKAPATCTDHGEDR